MNKTKGMMLPYPSIAQERGTAVPFTKIAAPDGSANTLLHMDLSKAVCPDKSYPSDMVGAVYENGDVTLLFGQSSRGGKVRSLVEVSMSPVAALQFLRANTAMKQPTVDEIMQKVGAVKRTVSTFDEDPKEVARLKANFVSLAFFGSEACIDFYDASAFSMGNLQRMGGATMANVVGVVRIDTQTALVKALFDRIAELSSQFPSQARAMEG